MDFYYRVRISRFMNINLRKHTSNVKAEEKDGPLGNKRNMKK